MKKDLKSKLVNRKVNKPDPLLMSVALLVLRIMNKAYKVEFTYDYDRDLIKGQPTILLSSHAARLEFIYSIYGFGRKDVNVVCGYQNILQKGLYSLMLRLGVISKYLYQPDVSCVKNMLHVLKRGGAIGLFPEGIQSSSGSTHPINPATAKFIKKSKANIVVCSTKGAYLATNRYSSDRKKGYIGVNYTLLFTPAMLQELSEEQIYNEILNKISYNDFAYNRTARNKYVGKKPNAFGLDRILYKCPACKNEHKMRVENDAIVCGECGFGAKVDEYYDLLDSNGKVYPFNIDSWYKWQRSCVAEQIKEESFELNLSGSLCTLKLDRLRKAPRDREILSVGEAKLTNRGLTFRGTVGGEKSDFDFHASSVYSLTCTTKNELEFFCNGEYFMIIPEAGTRKLIRWTLASEEIHNLYDEKWRAACTDVYEYNKVDIYEGDVYE